MKANKENSSPSVPAANLHHPFQGSEAAQLQQKDPQQLAQLQQQHQEQAQQPKEPFPQPGPPRQAKHAMVDYPEEEKEATAPPPKIPRLETTPLPLPPDWKSPINPVSGEADAGGPVAASDLSKVQLPPPAHPAPMHQPPSLGPPPPLPYSYVTGMSSTSSFMSGEGYQNLQSMMKTNRSSDALRPAYGRRAHLPHQPHVYSPNLPLPPVFPPPASFLPPTIPPRIPRYPRLLPPNILNFPPPPPCRPPIRVAPPRHLRGLVLPPASYLPAGAARCYLLSPHLAYCLSGS